MSVIFVVTFLTLQQLMTPCTPLRLTDVEPHVVYQHLPLLLDVLGLKFVFGESRVVARLVSFPLPPHSVPVVLLNLNKKSFSLRQFQMVLTLGSNLSLCTHTFVVDHSLFKVVPKPYNGIVRIVHLCLKVILLLFGKVSP